MGGVFRAVWALPTPSARWTCRAFSRDLRGHLGQVLDLGGHGDVRLVVRVFAPRGILWNHLRHDVAQDLVIEGWTGLDLDESRERQTLWHIETEVGRALGIPPRPLDPQV